MIKNELVNQGIDYILKHLDEELTIEKVANHCHISKFHFCRIFKEETREGIYGFIKRMKLEQSALNLKFEKEKTATDIGSDYGYSSSNYSTAFKKHYRLSPSEFRSEIESCGVLNPYNKGSIAKFQSVEEYNRRIRIVELEDFFVVHERYLGNYLDLGKNWGTFVEKYKDYQSENTLLIERFYTDPSVTDINQCLYDICMTVERGCILENTMIIQGGKFAIYRFDGMVKDIFTAFQGVYNVWLPFSGFKMDERYGLDIYRLMDREKMEVIMDLCIPIK